MQRIAKKPGLKVIIVGGVIEKEASLLVADETTFRSPFAIDVRTGCECIKVSPDAKTVELRIVATGEVTSERFDKLVLSPGAPSIRPSLHGIDLPGIFEVRTVPDARATPTSSPWATRSR